MHEVAGVQEGHAAGDLLRRPADTGQVGRARLLGDGLVLALDFLHPVPELAPLDGILQCGTNIGY